MSVAIEYQELDASLQQCGSTWNAGQTHGMLCSQLAVLGAAGGSCWLELVLGDADRAAAPSVECAAMLDRLCTSTHRQLAERMSEFAPLLPEEGTPIAARTEALGQWCEGFLHGLVSTARDDALKDRLAAEPLGEIIRDLLQITRATAGEETEAGVEDEAYEEIFEYIRVVAQLVYEELADHRNSASRPRRNDAAEHILH